MTRTFEDEPSTLHGVPFGSIPRRSIYHCPQESCIASFGLPVYPGSILPMVSVKCMFTLVGLCFSWIICPSVFHHILSNFFLNSTAMKLCVVVLPTTVLLYFKAIGLKSGDKSSALKTINCTSPAFNH